MAESVFEAVKQSITVREAAQMYGIEVNRSGMACCPFHDDKNPSMKLNEEYFYCFGCGATGDVIDFTARLYNLSPKEAAEKLAQDFGLAYDSQAPPRRRYVRQKSEAQKFKEDRDHAFRVLADYFQYPHLLEIDETANSRLEQMMPQLAAAAGATEQLKARDPMKWVGLMNTCKAQAEEILMAELNYKNLFLYTKMRNVAGLSTSDAQKSSDMFAKCRYMDELTGNRGVIFATGTPVSNSMTELYTMQRYLQYDRLQELNMTHFDCWASRFGETVTALELAPEGTGYRARTRFSKFFNLPELMNLFKEVADIKTADQLNLPTPEVEYHNIVAQPTEHQKEMVQVLSERASRVHSGSVDPSEDNMLKITGDGRKLGLDQRIINQLLPDEPGTKVNQCVGNIMQIWRDGEADKLTQLVFCDISTPQAAPSKKAAKQLDNPTLHALEQAVPLDEPEPAFTIYEDIRQKLIAQGKHTHTVSIETQQLIIARYLEQNPEIIVVQTYIDNGATGTNFHRPGFQQMLSDIEAGLINCVIVKDLSRLGRNVIDTGYYIERYFPMQKVRFIAVNDRYDSSSPDNAHDGIIIPLRNMINEAYAMDIARKIKAQQRQAMKDGKYVGGRTPYGYLKAPDDCHQLIVDPVAAEVVKTMFQWAAEGAGLNTIAVRLNEAGYFSPSHYKRTLGEITHENLVGNGHWQTRTVAKILRAEVYTGDLVQGVSKIIDHKQVRASADEWTTVRGTHEAIISRELFAAVQKALDQAAQQAKDREIHSWSPNLLKGKIFCAQRSIGNVPQHKFSSKSCVLWALGT